MTRTYFDTSALRHALLATAHSERVRREIEAEQSVCTTSDIATTELHRLASRYPGLTTAAVDDLLGRVDLVPISPDQLRAAGLLPDVPSGTPLRSLDAVHIQAALDAGATAFVTSDQRQARAAEAVGLRVELLS